jgi:hypothetical protein
MRQEIGMLRLILAITLVVGAAFAGAAFAHWSLRPANLFASEISNGVWRTSLKVGAETADARTRAYVARYGLLGLSRKEAVYFQAYSDSDGNPLSSEHVYEVRGRDLPGRWWSLTLYNHDSFLTPNEYKIYSVRGADIEREEDGGFVVALSREPRQGNWIATAEGRDMSLSLRLYNPDPGDEERLGEIVLPSIVRVD